MNDKTKTILGKSLIIFGILIFLFIILNLCFTEGKIVEKKVKCFDRYGHEIIGQSCLETYDERVPIIFLTVLLVAIIIGAGMTVLTSRSYMV